MPGPVPTWAKNQTELGRYLTPPRDRKIIQLAQKLEGNPGRTPDNRYEIAPWQTFITANFAAIGRPATGDKAKLEIERLRLQNAKLEFELQIKRKDFSANADVELRAGQMIMNAKRVLLQLPSKLAPPVISLNEVEAEKRMREEINAALELLTASPLHAAPKG